MRSEIRCSLALSTLLAAAAGLSAQRSNEWARTVEPRPDHTIFSKLDLPTPNRLRTASGAPGPDYWQQQVDYAIEVSLDLDTRLIHGRERVTYTNNSPEPLDYLWVHLEQNRLRADSIGERVGGGDAVGGDSENNDGVKVLELSSRGQPLPYQVYDTMMRVEVPAAVAPGGGTFEFDVTWEFTVPSKVFRRYGTRKVRQGTTWEIAQWFPAVAVYDDVYGWNTLPYLGNGEFYTNFGNYDLRITAPRDHIVVASGVLQNPADVYTQTQRDRLAQARRSEETVVIRTAEEVGSADSRPAGEGPLTWHFRAENVRTVAWASSEAFILDAVSGGDDLLVQSVYPEEDERTWSQSSQMLRTAILGYNRRWFPYPYPVATNVSGVEGGMEYPMIIFCRAGDERGLYGVTTHEIGHNWFPMMVNTDERRHAWMDEGFNTFINIYSGQDWFGKPPSSQTGRMGAMMGTISRAPIATPADQLGGMELGLLQYQKTGTGLQMLREHILGAERFDFAFRTYIRRWAFKSPQPADFFRTMEDAAGMDLAWFWRGWFLEAAKLDQAIDGVRQSTSRRGARITFTNLQRMVMPLVYKVTFVDDTTEVHNVPVQVWFTSNRVVQRLDTVKEVRKVELDPDHLFPDASRNNNEWTADN